MRGRPQGPAGARSSLPPWSPEQLGGPLALGCGGVRLGDHPLQSQSGIDLYGSAATRRHLLTPMDEPEGESRHLACHSDIGKFVWFG